MAMTSEMTRAGRVGLPHLQPSDPFLITLAVLAGLVLVVGSTSLGSGDYGQWLMAARAFNDLSVPDYRAAGAVPPVVPFVLAQLVSLLGDALVAIQVFAVLILCALGASAYVAATTLFRSRRAGLLATVLALVVVDQFLDLFAFGGLLQATAIAFALQGVPTARPMTHDLMKNILEDLAVQVQRIVVTELRDSTFFATIHMAQRGDDFEVSSRPSDAIALAVRMSVPIFANEDVLDEASILIPGDEEEEVEKFREFLDNVRPEDFEG